MKLLLTLTLAFAAACATPLPVILGVDVSGNATIRSNLAQTLIMADGDVRATVETSDGLPLREHEIKDGGSLWIDRTNDTQQKLAPGEPFPAAAKALFPVLAKAAALGITFENE